MERPRRNDLKGFDSTWSLLCLYTSIVPATLRYCITDTLHIYKHMAMTHPREGMSLSLPLFSENPEAAAP
jgi:hypothetical protein